jgi:hypothetical protein
MAARNASASISTACVRSYRAPERKMMVRGIIDLVRLTKPDNTTAILVLGVSLSLRGSGRLDTRFDTPPISFRHHPDSSIARGHGPMVDRTQYHPIPPRSYATKAS